MNIIILEQSVLEKGCGIIKTCSRCKRELPLDRFSVDKRAKCGVSNLCKDCRREYDKHRYKCGKNNVDSYKTNCAKCDCAEPYVLTFHHVDPSTKSFEISGSRKNTNEIANELKKCICLCYNCHHTYHYFYGSKPINPTESLKEFLQDDWKPN